MSDTQNTGNYKVGYKNPPLHTQFKPGQSGNRKGRPKGSKNLKTDLREELAERVEIKEGDRTKTISKQRLLVKSILARGIKESDVAAARLLDLIVKAFGLGDDGSGNEELSAEEREILAFAAARLNVKTSTENASAANSDGTTEDKI